MDNYTLIRKLEGHHNDVVSCEFSPDGALLATASYDTRVIVWDHHKATILLELGYETLTHTHCLYFSVYINFPPDKRSTTPVFPLNSFFIVLQSPLSSPIAHFCWRRERPLGPLRELLLRRPPHCQRHRRPVRHWQGSAPVPPPPTRCWRQPTTGACDGKSCLDK